MNVFTLSFIFIIVLSCMIREACAIPVAHVMGCGKPNRELSADQRLFCCSQLNVNCADDVADSDRVPETSPKKTTDISTTAQKEELKKPSSNSLPLLRVRVLGQGCTSIRVRCATGLECRLGVCMRKKGERNLRHLIAVGKKVEQEEKEEVAEDGDVDDEDDTDPSAVKEDIAITGQSFIEGDNLVPLAASKVERAAEMQATSPIADRADVQGDLEDDNDGKVNDTARVLKLDKAASGIEEDEVTANIADFLASRGSPLDEKEWKAVREIISGTLDERAQREDEVDEVNEEINRSNPCKDAPSPVKPAPVHVKTVTKEDSGASNSAAQCDAAL